MTLVMKTKVASYHQQDEIMPQKVWFDTGWPQKKYKKVFECNLLASLRKVMKTKGVSYHIENDLMLLKCLGCYRVTTENAINNKTVI